MLAPSPALDPDSRTHARSFAHGSFAVTARTLRCAAIALHDPLADAHVTPPGIGYRCLDHAVHAIHSLVGGIGWILLSVLWFAGTVGGFFAGGLAGGIAAMVILLVVEAAVAFAVMRMLGIEDDDSTARALIDLSDEQLVDRVAIDAGADWLPAQVRLSRYLRLRAAAMRAREHAIFKAAEDERIGAAQAAWRAEQLEKRKAKLRKNLS